MKKLMENEPFYACILDAEYYDTGSKLGYLKANIDYALEREEFREKWQDSRSSINDIGTYAHQIAKKIKEQLRLSEKEG